MKISPPVEPGPADGRGGGRPGILSPRPGCGIDSAVTTPPTNYPIRMYGDPVLREEGRPVACVDEEMRQLARDMIHSMYTAQGIGLAAQQIGETRMICVVDVPPEADLDEDGERANPDVPMPMVLINPELTGHSDEQDTAEEGCLSFPEFGIQVTRSSEVDVTYLDAEGREQAHHLKGLIARAVQHEIDHLHGILFIDHASHVKKIALKGRLKRLRRDTEQRLGLA